MYRNKQAVAYQRNEFEQNMDLYSTFVLTYFARRIRRLSV